MQTHIDSFTKFIVCSIFSAIFYAAGVLGPALGYMVGGYMLAVYTDFIDFDANA